MLRWWAPLCELYRYQLFLRCLAQGSVALSRQFSQLPLSNVESKLTEKSNMPRVDVAFKKNDISIIATTLK